MARWALSRQATLIIAVAGVFLLLVSIVARWQLATAWEAGNEVVRTQQVLAATQQLLGHLLDAETGQRGYLITGSEAYLAPYDAGRAAARTDLDRLQRLLGGDPERARRLQNIGVLTTVKLDELQRAIDARRSEGVEAANALVANDVGRLTMERVRALLGELNDEVRGTLEQGLRARAVERGRLANVLFGGALAALGVLLGAILAVNGAARRQARAERRLRQSEERLRTTLRSIGDAVIATDTDGRIVFINPVAQALTGWDELAAIGEPLERVFAIVNEETRQTVDSPVDKVLREGAIVGLANHTVLIARDGRELPIDDSGAPIRDADSAIMGVVLVFRDVSERKAMETEHEARLRAEAAIAGATAAREAAESANVAKDQFLAMLSHELRSPLNVIVSWLAALRRGVDGPQLERALDTLERNVRVQAQLINDLLDVSRIVSGKLGLERGPIDLGAIARTAVESARPTAVARGVGLHADLEPLRGSVIGDAQRLLQVITNLLNNALKFTPSGGRVDVRLGQRDHLACLDVIDTGIGIAPEFLPHVFDRFRQSDERDTRGHGGLGLGLSIVKHLVERHGGTVEARSDGIGAGAHFSVCLPLDEAPAGEQVATVPAQSDEGTDLRGVHVLLVDDDADTRDGLRLALEIHGARVSVAESIAAARALLTVERPDALISDIGMPGGSGLELIRGVRQELADLPAIALSGYASREDRAAALAAGFTEHLTKPVDIGRLLAQVRRVTVGGAGGRGG
ncbi:CHASE3 domain-containing protein [bacterium]|nr:CHASE3 domain-containing protein [bacterium]